MAANSSHPNRQWLRAVWVDSALSFAAVLIFTGVFTACGAVILGPRHEFPDGSNLLTLQSQFIAPEYPWLKQVYFVGAFLTIFGTLYGTIEVAPAVLREIILGFDPRLAASPALRRSAVVWCGGGGFVVLLASLLYSLAGRAGNPPGLIALLTPANLFTGVLSCGIICLLAVWADRKHLPVKLRMNAGLALLTFAAGVVFVLLGLKGYRDEGGAAPWWIFAGTLAAGWGGAAGLQAIAIRGKK